MAKSKGSTSTSHTSVHKRDKQGWKVKTSSMNKTQRRNFKKYRGQGK